jgi:hypothetical protein
MAVIVVLFAAKQIKRKRQWQQCHCPLHKKRLKKKRRKKKERAYLQA